MDNMTQSLINRAGTSGYDWGFGQGFDLGVDTFAPETAGGMSFGPTPDGQLDMTIGPKSRQMSNLGWFTRNNNMGTGLPGGAMGGFGTSVGWFLNRPPLAAPNLSVQLPGYQVPQQAAGRTGGGRSPGRSRMSVSNGKSAKAAADAKNIDELATKYREANGEAEAGYSAEDMDGIIDEAESVADGDYGKFKSIMKSLPARDDENWVQGFGEWHAKHLGGVEGKERVAQLVRDTASGDGAKFELTKAPTKKGKGFNRFQVSSVDGESEVEEGDYLFYNPADKKFYREYDKQTKEFSGEVGKASENPLKANGKSKPTVALDLGAGSDYVELTPNGVYVGPNPVEDGHTMVFDQHVIGSDVGDQSAEWVKKIAGDKGNNKVSHGKDSLWYYKDDEGEYQEIEGAELVDGRLYFSKGGNFDEDNIGSTADYMSDLSAAATEFDARMEDLKADEVHQKTDRVEKAWTQLVGMMGEDSDVAKNISYEYDAEEGVLKITCDKNDCDEVRKALEGGNDPATKGDAILKEFPEGTKVEINPDGDHSKPFKIGSKSFSKFTGELAKETPADVVIDDKISLAHLKNKDAAKTDEPKSAAKPEHEPKKIDLSSKSSKAVFKKLDREVKKQLKEHHNLKSISFDGEIILPEGVIDQAEWDKIKAKLSEENGGVSIGFLDADSHVQNIASVVKPDPDGDGAKDNVQAKKTAPPAESAAQEADAAPAAKGPDVKDEAPAADDAEESAPVAAAVSPQDVNLSGKKDDDVYTEMSARTKEIAKANPKDKTITIEDKVILPKDMSIQEWEKINKRISEANGGNQITFTNVVVGGKSYETVASNQGTDVTENKPTGGSTSAPAKPEPKVDTTLAAGESVKHTPKAGEGDKAKKLAALNAERKGALATVGAKKKEAKDAAEKHYGKQMGLNTMNAKIVAYEKSVADLKTLVAKYKAIGETAEAKKLEELANAHNSFVIGLGSVRQDTDATKYAAVMAKDPDVKSTKKAGDKLNVKGAVDSTKEGAALAFFEKNYATPVKKKCDGLVKKLKDGKISKEEFVKKYDAQLDVMKYGLEEVLEKKINAEQGKEKLAEAKELKAKTAARKHYAIGHHLFNKAEGLDTAKAKTILYAKAEAEFSEAYDLAENKSAAKAVDTCKTRIAELEKKQKGELVAEKPKPVKDGDADKSASDSTVAATHGASEKPEVIGLNSPVKKKEDEFYTWSEMRENGLKDHKEEFPFMLVGNDGDFKVNVVSRYRIPTGDKKMILTLKDKNWKLIPDKNDSNYLIVIGKSKISYAAKQITNQELKQKFLQIFEYKVA